LTEHNNQHSTAASLVEKLRGILLPFTTPFEHDGSVDLEALRLNIISWNATDITGYVALGSTGERVHLNEREYVQVIEKARREVSSDRAFIAGAGQQSTRTTIEEIELAAKAGADAVLVLTPYFYRSAITQEALVDFYNAVADASSLPVILYSMPVLTGIAIEPETIARLSNHENIIGVKDSSADVPRFARTVELVEQDDFVILTGNGTVLFDCLQAGADGAILAVGCVAPEICTHIFSAMRAGELDNATELQRTLTPLARAVTTEYGIGGLKAAMTMAGYKGGVVRAPLGMPDQNGEKQIASVLAAARPSLSLP
jgi:4-hydroxy-2-oxoglutarate aldolase